MYRKPLFLLLLLTSGAVLNLCAQLKPGERPVTVHKKTITIADLFRSIGEQVRMHAFFSEQLLDPNEQISADFDRTSLDSVLSFVIGKKGLTWKYYDDAFVIIEDEHSKPGPAESLITGQVLDENGASIPGVSILVKNSDKRIQTDGNGKFTVDAVERKTSLVFSYMGYDTKEVSVSIGEKPTVRLTPSTTILDETVVIAYGASTRRKLTGSVSKVTAADIVKQSAADPLTALQGKAAGLNITQLSGLPGGEVKVELRGRTSITAGNRPLYIVDGIPFPSLALSFNALEPMPPIGPLGASNPLNMFNVPDIASVEVLKDADATAIYGSRGANGVILITTKKAGIGKMKMETGIYTGIGRVAHHPRFLNTEQYLKMRNEALRNDGQIAQAGADYDLLNWDTTRYTDWEKKMLGGTAHISDAQLAIEGGNAMSTFRISGGYHRETTVYPGNFGYKKMSARAFYSLTNDNKKGRIVFNTTYVDEQNRLPPNDLAMFSTLPPNAPALYHPDGTLNWENNTFDNPMGQLERPYKAKSSNLMITSELSYDFLPNLYVKTNAAFNSIRMNEVQINPWYALDPSAGYGSSVGGFTYFSDGRMDDWIIEPKAGYNTAVGGGKLETLIGASFQQDIKDQRALYAYGFTSNNHLERLEAAYKIERIGSFGNRYRYSAFFGRVTYNWQEKYILSLNGRRDASSRFAPGKRLADFWSVAGAWIFSKEQWIQKTVPILSFGKLRANYGITGNDQISDHGYSNSYYYSSLSYGQQVNWFPARLGAPDYRWELNAKLEFGLDLGLFRDKIMLRTCYYRHRSTNQLVDHPQPGTTGFSSVYNNFNAGVRNTGIELELNTINLQRRSFTWNTAFNLSIPKNKLLFFPNLESTSYNSQLMVGQPLNINLGLNYEGVDPSTGTYRFTGVDSSGKLSYNVPKTPKRIGTLFYGGLQHHLEFRNWQLDLFFYFVKQNRYNYLYAGQAPGISLFNQPVEVLDRWQTTGDKRPFQRFTQGAGSAYYAYTNLQKSDVAITDASFLRLRSLCLAYQPPRRWLDRLHIQQARFYLQGQNLLTFTGYGGRDPEVAADHDVYPPLKWWILGVQLSL